MVSWKIEVNQYANGGSMEHKSKKEKKAIRSFLSMATNTLGF
jgi:hypothetical protein